jgi:hypothetical protein
MGRPKKIKPPLEKVEVVEEIKPVEQPVEKRNFPVILKETKKPAIIKKSEYNPLLHVAI